jgi:hypothetical protein|tara:strand:+ start:2515 stop:4083 length:1569 start_codon:yes stop_codon:yes gene_type:complete
MFDKLSKLFEGNLSSFIKSSISSETDERGKQIVKYLTIQEPLSTKHWKEHLNGKTRVGVKPEREGKCKWGCIDVDPSNYTNYNQKKYVDIIRDYKLPLVPIKSKSGGLHIFVFLTEWYDVSKIAEKLSKINEKFFMAQEIFPCNKAMNLPYQNMNRSMEFAYDDNNNPLLIEAFIELANNKKILPEDFLKLKLKEYEPEENWKQYPPCVQKLIQERWTGTNRNNYLFNVLVLEMKKNTTHSVQSIEEIAQSRNTQIFHNPLPRAEVTQLAKSVHKGTYDFRCPPKSPELMPLCNKDLCKQRRLGIGEATPEVIEDFTNITFIRDTKNIWYEFDYQEQRVTITPEDMKDEKSFRTRLLRYRIFWMTLPKSKRGPSPFELLMKGIVERSIEDDHHKFEDTLEEEKYNMLKKFFESHIEQDNYDKLKDGYVVLDTKDNVCYFKKITLDKFIKKQGAKIFNTTSDALRLLGCSRKDYHEGEKNIWYVTLPEFISHETIKQKPKEKVTELDEEYYDKFKTTETKSNL